MIRFSSLKSRLYRLQDDRPWSRYIYLIPCFLSFFLLDFTFRYIYADFGSTGLWNKIPLLFSFGWSILFTGIICILPRPAKQAVMIFLSLVYGLFCIVHGVMLNLFRRFFSFSDLVFAETVQLFSIFTTSL